MGDMADYYNELQEEGGRYFPPGDLYRVRAVQKSAPRCQSCGAVCKWCINDNGKWQLFEQQRGEHNRNVPHQCNPVTADDFDIL
jgi:hypothetical protein